MIYHRRCNVLSAIKFVVLIYCVTIEPNKHLLLDGVDAPPLSIYPDRIWRDLPLTQLAFFGKQR
jgi:hypothetical protein